jgi:hypothetical protein
MSISHRVSAFVSSNLVPASAGRTASVSTRLIQQLFPQGGRLSQGVHEIDKLDSELRKKAFEISSPSPIEPILWMRVKGNDGAQMLLSISVGLTPVPHGFEEIDNHEGVARHTHRVALRLAAQNPADTTQSSSRVVIPIVEV